MGPRWQHRERVSLTFPETFPVRKSRGDEEGDMAAAMGGVDNEVREGGRMRRARQAASGGGNFSGNGKV